MDMKETAAFYGTEAWKRCRRAYKKYRGGLCERCLAKGLYEPGTIVHHKIYMTPETMNNPRVALDFDNLELLCRACHAEEHEPRKRRYKVDELGNVIVN